MDGGGGNLGEITILQCTCARAGDGEAARGAGREGALQESGRRRPHHHIAKDICTNRVLRFQKLGTVRPLQLRASCQVMRVSTVVVGCVVRWSDLRQSSQHSEPVVGWRARSKILNVARVCTYRGSSTPVQYGLLSQEYINAVDMHRGPDQTLIRTTSPSLASAAPLAA